MNPDRRRFIEITPIAALALLGACSDRKPADTASPAPAPSPASPAPAPTAPPPTAASPAPAAPAAAPPAPQSTAAPNLPMLQESDPLAVSLGYVNDAKRADATKYKNYAAGQQCANCQLYAGKAGDSGGPCPLFPGRQVAAPGWCSSWVKKTG